MGPHGPQETVWAHIGLYVPPRSTAFGPSGPVGPIDTLGPLDPSLFGTFWSNGAPWGSHGAMGAHEATHTAIPVKGHLVLHALLYRCRKRCMFLPSLSVSLCKLTSPICML
jgi:hypothetical protein